MANVYGNNPIILTATMASGWRALQSLNHNYGFHVYKVIWAAPASVADTFLIVDPIDSTTRLTGSVGAYEAGTNKQWDYDNNEATWRDFQLTQISSGTLYIYYRD